jgi:hypothetical protein
MKTKFNLDRDKLNSDYIQTRQDYQKVLDGFQKLKPPIWKNPWFYGPVGLASLAVILVITFQSSVNAYGNNTTLKNTTQSSNSLPDDTPCIKAPIAKKDIDFQIINVLPEKGKEITLESGTKISIPANSLQSEIGTPVQLKIREFPDKASVFLAGIPMDYGDNYAFESAGMIEIRAEKDGESILLDDNKPMEVSMAMYKSPDGFQFWKLDESKREWVETPCVMRENSNLTTNQKLKKVESKLVKIEKDIESCDKQISQLSTTNSNNLLLPTENARKLVIDFDQSDFPELKGYKDIEFEYILPKNRSEASLSEYAKKIKYAQSQIWNDMEIVKQNDHYLATFINTKEKYSLPIRPVLKGKSLEELHLKMATASEERSKALSKISEERKAFVKEQAKLKREQELLNAQLLAEIKRSAFEDNDQRIADARNQMQSTNSLINQATANFRTTSFGVFNCDKPIPYPPSYPQYLVFETKEGQNISAENAFIFDNKKDTRYSFGPYFANKTDKLGWFNHESTLIILDKSGNVYFRKNVNDHSKASNKIIVQHLEKKALNLEDIQNIVSETPVAV